MKRHRTSIHGLFFAVCIFSALFACAEDGKPPPAPPRPLGGQWSKRVVFVCDASDTMLHKMDMLPAQLGSAIDSFPAETSFDVIFMRDKACTKASEALLSATPANKERAKKFIVDFKPGRNTDALPALKAAFRLNPQALFFLEDHDPANADQLPRQVHDLNVHHKAKVHSIALLDDQETVPAFVKLLQQISLENGGIFKLVRTSNFGPGK